MRVVFRVPCPETARVECKPNGRDSTDLAGHLLETEEAVSDLIEWLTQIWDEQEKSASEEVELTQHVYDRSEFTVEYQWARMTKHASGGYGSSFAPGAPSPTEVLAKIAADREILALYQKAWSGLTFDDPQPEGAEWLLGHRWGLAEAVRLLALPYADRDGYDEEWRP